MKKLQPIALATLLALGLASGAQAQTTTAPADSSQNTSTRATVPEADRDFIKAAAESGHAEVQAARMAVAKSTNAEIKKYAQMLIDDHTKANAKLAQIAKSKKVSLPKEPSLMQKGKLQLLKRADGVDFDKRFAEDMGVDAHRKVIELFREEVANGRDPEVKAFAQETLPKLEQHLEMAQKLQNQTDKRDSDVNNKVNAPAK